MKNYDLETLDKEDFIVECLKDILQCITISVETKDKKVVREAGEIAGAIMLALYNRGYKDGKEASP